MFFSLGGGVGGEGAGFFFVPITFPNMFPIAPHFFIPYICLIPASNQSWTQYQDQTGTKETNTGWCLPFSLKRINVNILVIVPMTHVWQILLK